MEELPLTIKFLDCANGETTEARLCAGNETIAMGWLPVSEDNDGK